MVTFTLFHYEHIFSKRITTALKVGVKNLIMRVCYAEIRDTFTLHVKTPERIAQ